MRTNRIVLLAGAALCAQPAFAADTLKYGPPPAWVHQQPIPAPKASDAPVAILLHDQQIALERGKVAVYDELAFKIQNPQGLAAGNLSVLWQPATDAVTVNKLQIRRGDKVIDVLAGGQRFTTLRRETNLDAATLDGTLTGNIQPEGLQEGDIVDFATTTERSDPVVKGHVESAFAGWNGMPIQSAHAELSWPSSIHLNVRQTDNLPQAHRSTNRGIDTLELSAKDVSPLVPPNGAPVRFKIGRLGEATDFASWAELADLFMPLYRDASAIPASGPLHDEVEKIRSSTSDSKHRAELALALVQDRVRYVALEMGLGGLVPAAAETTWSRRFGDCKGKTALLLGILHSLGIEAEPVLVQSSLGDMIAGQLPMISLFDHVLVRAHIGAKDYWLDGTRTGDTDLDSIKVPDFSWGLPLIEHAQLVRMIPAPLDVPDSETVLQVDATGGVYATAPATAEETLRGDLAVATQAQLSALSVPQQQEFFRKFWTSRFDFLNFKTGSFSFDKAKRELRLTMTADANLDWTGGYFHVPESTVGYHPDFDRPAGPLQQAPFAVDYPSYNKTVVRLRMPASFIEGRKFGSASVHETIAGIEYDRSTAIDGNTLTVENSAKSLVPEITYKEAKSAEPRLIALSDEDVSLPLSGSYRMTEADIAALHKQEPTTADDLVTRGNNYLNANHLDDAIADFTKALSKDPKDVVALADRGIAFFYKKDAASAEKDLAAAEAIDPSNAVLLRARAMMATERGDTDTAIADYSKSLEREPRNGFALFHRSMLYLQKERADLAINDLSTILEQEPKNGAALIGRAQAYIYMQDYESAKKDLSAARTIDANNPAVLDTEARLAGAQGDTKGEVATYSRMVALTSGIARARALVSRAKAYWRLKEYAEALADTDQALKLGDKDADLRVTRANILWLQGKKEAVAAEADALIRDNPSTTYPFVAAGKIYARAGRQADALKAFDRALAIRPEAYVYINRSQVRPESDVSGKMADLNQALKLDPDSEDALENKANLLSRQHDYSGAIALLARIKPVPGDTYPQQRTAVLMAKMGRTAEAQKTFETLRSSAKGAQDYNGLCWDKATAGIMLESALQDCREALKLKPDEGAYLDSLGMVLLKLGKLDDALAAYNRAVANGTGADSLMGRAFVYLKKGDRRHAEADAEAARKLAPDIDSIFDDYDLKFDEAGTASPAAGGAATRH